MTDIQPRNYNGDHWDLQVTPVVIDGNKMWTYRVEAVTDAARQVLAAEGFEDDACFDTIEMAADYGALAARRLEDARLTEQYKEWTKVPSSTERHMTYSIDRVAMVREFMEAFGHKVRTSPTARLEAMDLQLRGELVLEEAMEFVEALGLAFVFESPAGEISTYKPTDYASVRWEPGGSVDLEAVADALIDCLVVVYGSLLAFGLPTDDLFREVHRSNMSKLGPDGKPILRESDGRIMKSESWSPPDLLPIIELHQAAGSPRQMTFGELSDPSDVELTADAINLDAIAASVGVRRSLLFDRIAHEVISEVLS